MVERETSDEFYVGYENEVPAVVTARLRWVVPTVVMVALAGAALTLVLHEGLLPSRFDFGRPHRVEGVLTRRPYPMLNVSGRPIWLVGQGKHGADSTLGTTPDGTVRLDGATIARDGVEMLEVVSGSVEPVSGGTSASPVPTAPPTGDFVTLTGEIVDSKCHLGVMNPGDGTVHRDCARLCLRGRIPPMLLVREAGGHESLVLLVGADNRALGPELAGLAGLAVRVRGRLAADHPLPRLAIDAAAVTRLPRP